MIDKALEILAALARYGYLTPQQIQRLGIYGDKASLYAALRRLTGHGLASGTAPQSLPGAGRFPAVYALTPKGAEHVGLALDELVLPLRGATPGAPPLDVEHRTAIVDCHIALDAWAATAGHTVGHFLPDFARGGRKGRRATAITTPHGDYTPDALAWIDGADGVRRPLVLEVYRGGLTDRPGYLLKKLPDNLRHVATDAVRDRLGQGYAGTISAPRLLVVTATPALRDAVLAKPPAPELPAWRVTFIKSLDEVAADFGTGWWRLGRQQEPLFSVRPPALPAA